MIFFVLELQKDFFDFYTKLTQASEAICLTFSYNDIKKAESVDGTEIIQNYV